MLNVQMVMSSVSQESVIGLALFNFLISYNNSGVECTLIKFTDDTELWSVVNTTKNWDAVH